MNLIFPLLLRESLEKMVFWTRVGYFFFWGAWSMGVFTGLIVFMFTQRELTNSVIIMIVASLLLAILDGYRSIKTRRIWATASNAIRFSSTILLIEIAIVAIVTVVAIRGS
jgi:hypothetical protein